MWHTYTRFPIRFFQSVRFRLTLWYLALLTVIIGGFGLTVYYAQQHTLATQLEDTLRTRAQQIALTYNATTQRLDITEPVFQKPATASTISVATRGLNINEVAVLLSPEGNVLQKLGNVTPAGVSDIAILTRKASLDTTRGFLIRLPDESLTLATSGKPSDYGLVAMAIIQQQNVVAYLVFGAPSDISQQLASLATTLLMAGALVLLFAALGGFWLAGRAMRPIQTITATAQQIGASDLSRRIALKRRDELGELAGTFDHMLERLEKAFARQRQFTADASHELRTPLTIIELEVSRLLDQPTMTDSQRAALTVIQTERQHMAHLVDDLLFLARADAGNASVRHEIVHLDELIIEVAERFAPLAQQRHLQIQVGALPDLTVLGDGPYLMRMLGNIVENAVKYTGPDGSCVQIALTTDEQDGFQWAQLTVSDDGPGIAAEHLPHVFERFYRADVSRTHTHTTATLADADEPTGSGLGLAIARWIAQAHGGEITLRSDIGASVTCAMLLPLRRNEGCV
jgi:signal transduction histidine kinase